ncbi:MAG: uracil-DNA glycosylase [Candidatus Paceibacterota bacterium]|jgi:DNA polymerase
MKGGTRTQALQKIKDDILKLKKSPLYSYRIKNNYFPVIGEGGENAKIMFIGEAPGRNEAKTGKPFCGAAGKILSELLEHAGLKREDVYITNIVKDRPPENRDPTPKEIKLYGPFLDQEIDILQPKIIATLGRYSMQYILEKFRLESKLEPIGKAHGKTHPIKTTHGNVSIVILYHPCVTIYNPKTKSVLKKDIEILKTL